MDFEQILSFSYLWSDFSSIHIHFRACRVPLNEERFFVTQNNHPGTTFLGAGQES